MFNKILSLNLKILTHPFFYKNMLKKLLTGLALSLLTGIGFSQQAKHVVVISIDGFRPDFYLDLMFLA